MRKITVNASTSYDILIGDGLLSDCGDAIAAVKAPCRALLVCDSNVAPLWADEVAVPLVAAGFSVKRFVFPAGEASKDVAHLAALLNALGENGFTRSDLVVALGGGVTGDLAGFAAAVYCRGMDCVQIPTTLLSAVDSSVGGKTAVNLDCGKNMAGCFRQPALVLFDPQTLETLPEREFSSGMAEVIKYGAIFDADLFNRTEDGAARRDAASVVARCCELKRDVVEQDERDNGQRRLLNFGHTIGHAAERASNFSLSHGEAVAIGMVAITRAAEKHGEAEKGTAARIAALCAANALPVSTDIPAEVLSRHARSDKKRSAGEVAAVIAEKIGSAHVRRTPLSELDQWIGEGVEA